MLPADHAARIARARRSLDGLSVGDAFGEQFFVHPNMAESLIADRAEPRAPWRWTDDTAMAISIVEVLDAHGRIDRDVLAERFGRRYARDPHRGYGGGAHQILRAISMGVPWDEAARMVFDGAGSMGNGAAMRSAPIGAYFAGDLDLVAREGRLSAEPTHAHEDGQAGAIAVAVAAAVASQPGTTGGDVLDEALARTPAGPTREGLERARQLFGRDASVTLAAEALGTGARVLSSDTVPFALFCAARHLEDYVEAMWLTLAGLGDRDTTCAIAGGIVALSSPGPPRDWLAAREPLP